MHAAIDVGSNSLRMLVGHCSKKHVIPEFYQQSMTRLGGDYIAGRGLAHESMERTLSVLATFVGALQEMNVEQVRLVGTAALRRAENSQLFINLVKLKTRLNLEIISGAEEARLSSRGVLAALSPVPESALIIDIGGGSTEIIFSEQQQILSSCSYPLGVVQLCEEMPETDQRQQYINDMVVKFSADLLHAGVNADQLSRCQLIGTAGTMTTLAAMDLKMAAYDREMVNNHQLDYDWLNMTLQKLRLLSATEREKLPGLEPGRGDLIIPGLELTIALCRYFRRQSVHVVDAGLLEGVLLDLCDH